ncbi:hypothetical protein MIND_00948200 [Mycena indigotica]|uniref:Uncharacterized protein n=1 Tax=Mycena indigotica TaxID=2126181 RepID=A0A8H6VX65_9AGAR|nr:uncharacterized protein MIND_00948200 [Mycena indigotica]KAF7297152.1 hypothetical protein MIND_00948200 [Mycena indigotica]
MPRAASTPTRRGSKQDSGQIKFARTAASVRAARFADSETTPPTTDNAPWRHVDELEYLTTGWSDMQLIKYVAASAFTIGPRPDHSAEAFFPVSLRAYPDLDEIMLPRQYRSPLLWLGRYLFTSVRLILLADPQILSQEWDRSKYELLYIARLCRTLLESARVHAESSGLDKTWRCPPFDRALRRYWHKWLIQRDEFVRDFWYDFGEEEFEGPDVLKLNWGQWILKGEAGFFITRAEAADGITADQFLDGLAIDEAADSFEWCAGCVPGSRVSLDIASNFSTAPPPPTSHSNVASTSAATRLPLPGEVRRQQLKELGHDNLRIKTEAISNTEPLAQSKEPQPANHTISANAYPSPPTDIDSSRETSAVAHGTVVTDAMDIDPPQDPPSLPTVIPIVAPTANSFRTAMGSLAPGRSFNRIPIVISDDEVNDNVIHASQPVFKNEPTEPSIPLQSAHQPMDMILLDDYDDEGLELGYPDDEEPRVDLQVPTFSSASRNSSGSPPPITSTTAAGPSRQSSPVPSPLFIPNAFDDIETDSPDDDDVERYTLSRARFQFPPIAPPAGWSGPLEEEEGFQSNAAEPKHWIDAHPVVIQLRAELLALKTRIGELEAELSASRGGPQ